MEKLLTAVAMLVAGVTFGGPALAAHDQPGSFVAGQMTGARTLYCISEADARAVTEYWVAGGDSAAMTLIRTLGIPTPMGILRCGIGQGNVTPISLVAQYTRGDEVMNLIRVLAGGIEIEIILITKIPLVLPGDPV